jgi:hypothetical protein
MIRIGVLAAVLPLAALPALPSELPREGSIAPTYHGGNVGLISAEAGGGFDPSAAIPLVGSARRHKIDLPQVKHASSVDSRP